MFGKLKELKEMQAKAAEIKKRLETITVRGSSTCQKVQVICSGNKIVNNVLIDESLLNTEHKKQLENNITEAINNAFKQAENLMESEMQTIAGALLNKK